MKVLCASVGCAAQRGSLILSDCTWLRPLSSKVQIGIELFEPSAESNRQIVDVAQAFERAHELGLATILWCYLRNSAFKADKDYHVAADLTGQANHLSVTRSFPKLMEATMRSTSEKRLRSSTTN